VPATYANKACNGGGTWWIDSTAIYTDCVDVAVCIDEVCYIYCPSEANKIAHELARVCFHYKGLVGRTRRWLVFCSIFKAASS
jgi:hypothetical protein